MRLEELEVSGFRNLARQNISFGPQVNLLTGQNGQGKTSLIEAVFVLSHGKSFRGAKIKELAAWPE
ncbi:MAG TPA: AAA family ATPase, partial [Oligoflexia bacterium]|nr:AAA family ATPase [Oligoflexia bacterium]